MIGTGTGGRLSWYEEMIDQQWWISSEMRTHLSQGLTAPAVTWPSTNQAIATRLYENPHPDRILAARHPPSTITFPLAGVLRTIRDDR